MDWVGCGKMAEWNGWEWGEGLNGMGGSGEDC